MDSTAADAADLENLLARVEEAQARLAPQLPDMDPGDLNAILTAIFRPWGTGRRFLLRQIRPGVNVF